MQPLDRDTIDLRLRVPVKVLLDSLREPLRRANRFNLGKDQVVVWPRARRSLLTGLRVLLICGRLSCLVVFLRLFKDVGLALLAPNLMNPSGTPTVVGQQMRAVLRGGARSALRALNLGKRAALQAYALDVLWTAPTMVQRLLLTAARAGLETSRSL